MIVDSYLSTPDSRPNNSRHNLKDRLVDSLFNLDMDRNGALSTKVGDLLWYI